MPRFSHRPVIPEDLAVDTIEAKLDGERSDDLLRLVLSVRGAEQVQRGSTRGVRARSV